MRSGSRGGLVASKGSKVKPDGVERKYFCTQQVKTLLATKPSSWDLKTKRTKEYAAPTHNARTTKAYSVSFPV